MKNLEPPTNWGVSRNTGYKGEVLVASILPGAVHINCDQDAMKSWDVVWEGILLDVKATEAKRATPKFTGYENHAEVIYVYVDMSYMDELLFWVRHTTQGFKNNQRISEALTSEQLPQAIRDCHNNYHPLYNKTVDKLHTFTYTPW